MNRDIFDIFFNDNINCAMSRDIKESESELMVVFPKLYKDLMMYKNGGGCRISLLSKLDTDLGFFYHIKLPGSPLETDLVYHNQNFYIPKKMIEFASNGYEKFCFNYNLLNEISEPKINIYDHERDKNEVIYDSFQELLEDLIED